MIRRRRLVQTALSAPLATMPLRISAQDRWSLVADAARNMDQLHTLQVAQGGNDVLAESFRGAGLDRSANIKSTYCPRCRGNLTTNISVRCCDIIHYHITIIL